MENINVLMKKPGKYIPDKKIYNQYYIDHFTNMGMPVEGLLNHLGRRKRYFALGDGETPLSMSVASVNDCLKINKEDAGNIDMVIFASDSPEYIVSNNAIRIAKAVGANNAILAFDFNSNCTSMLSAMEIAKNTMSMNNNVNKALIVGCFKPSMVSIPTDTVTYANFGDAASTILLEKVKENDKRGFIDVELSTNSNYCNNTNFPKVGMQNALNSKLNEYDQKLEWIPFDSKFIPDQWAQMIQNVLQRNQLSPKDIDYFVFSALSDFDNLKTLEKLGISESDKKYYYFGTEYGYTGCTCQALCLNRMWYKMAVPGNKIILCTVGAGASFIVQLYQF